QIPGYLKLPLAGGYDPLRLESNRRKLCDVEKVRTAQIVVTHLNPCIHGVGIDRNVEGRLGGIGSGVRNHAAHFREGSSYGRNSHMPHRKLRCGMGWIQMPGLGLRRCPAMEHAEQTGESADGKCEVKQFSFLHVGDSPLAMSSHSLALRIGFANRTALRIL